MVWSDNPDSTVSRVWWRLAMLLWHSTAGLIKKTILGRATREIPSGVISSHRYDLHNRHNSIVIYMFLKRWSAHLFCPISCGTPRSVWIQPDQKIYWLCHLFLGLGFHALYLAVSSHFDYLPVLYGLVVICWMDLTFCMLCGISSLTNHSLYFSIPAGLASIMHGWYQGVLHAICAILIISCSLILIREFHLDLLGLKPAPYSFWDCWYISVGCLAKVRYESYQSGFLYDQWRSIHAFGCWNHFGFLFLGESQFTYLLYIFTLTNSLHHVFSFLSSPLSYTIFFCWTVLRTFSSMMKKAKRRRNDCCSNWPITAICLVASILSKRQKKIKLNLYSAVNSIWSKTGTNSLCEVKSRWKRRRFHQLLLAKIGKRIRKPIKLWSGIHQGMYGKFPRLTRSLLLRHRKGLIATSCCMVPKYPGPSSMGIWKRQNRYCALVDRLAWWRFFISKSKTSWQTKILTAWASVRKKSTKKLLQLAAKYQVKVIATNDVHLSGTGWRWITWYSALYHGVQCRRMKTDFRFQGSEYFLSPPGDGRKFAGCTSSDWANCEIAEKVFSSQPDQRNRPS